MPKTQKEHGWLPLLKKGFPLQSLLQMMTCPNIQDSLSCGCPEAFTNLCLFMQRKKESA